MTDTATRPPQIGRIMHFALRARQANMFLVLLFSLFIGLVFGGFLIILTTPALMTSWGHFFSHPGGTISSSFNTIWFAYEQLFQGALVNFHSLRLLIDNPSKINLANVLAPLSGTLTYATPLIVAGLGLAIGFRSSLFNIGGQGQVIVGGVLALLVSISFNLPPFFQVTLEIIAAVIGGALVAGLAGVLKAYTGAHEVIVTMMSNYTMVLILGYLLITSVFARPGVHDGASKAIEVSGQLPYFLSHLNSALLLNFGFPIAFVTVLAVQWFFNRSKTGFQLLMVGQNPDAARVAGIFSRRSIIICMALSGALLGLAGMLKITGVDHLATPNFGGSYGFDAITVALLGRNKPWGVFFGAIFFGVMYTGGAAMQAFTPTNIQFSLSQVIQAVVVFCVATPALVIEAFRLRDGASLISTNGSGGWV
jgi:general nucleoside transport system permease protein